MYQILMHSHSGLRYLVLLAGLIAAGYALYGTLARKPWSPAGRALGSTFVGLLDLQIVLGLVLLNWMYYPAVIGHLAMMIIGAVAAHAALVVNRRRATPTWSLLLIAVVVALACIIAGIYALPNRTPFGMTV